ncbi:MAG: hypothetical protein JO008_13245 [Alphaproteobacteria bacterium]|nr:hypothetical protein [Alphaproteobacteria bacterium]
MPVPTFEAIHDWHDFFVLLGTGAATLIGAMFVVVSIGSRFMTEQRLPHITAFISATVVHLSAVVLTCAVTMIPGIEWRWLGLVLGCGGAAGLAYCAVMGWRVVHGRVDWSDPVWYAAVPFLAYAVILLAGLSALRSDPSVTALAVGPVLLLLGGIRNSWDMIIYFALRDRGPE